MCSSDLADAIGLVQRHVVGGKPRRLVRQVEGVLVPLHRADLGSQAGEDRVGLAGIREVDKRQGWRGPKKTVDPATIQVPGAPVSDQPLKPGDLADGVVLKQAKDHYVVQVGDVTAKLSFDDMAWAKRLLKGSDPTVDFVINPNLKQLLKPGDVVEVGIKKLARDGMHLTLEQTPIVEGGLIAIDPKSGAIRAMVGGEIGRAHV